LAGLHDDISFVQFLQKVRLLAPCTFNDFALYHSIFALSPQANNAAASSSLPPLSSDNKTNKAARQVFDKCV
jgi:hypothetical protein